MRIDLEEWRELASPVYEVHPREPAVSAGISIELRTVEGLFVSEVESPAQVLVHDPANSKQFSHDYVLFERFYAGGGGGQVADVGISVAPSHLHLIDMSQRYVSVKGRSQSRGVCIPHAMLGYVPGEEPSFSALTLNSPAGRLVAAAHAELFAAEPDEATAPMIADAFVDLVRRFMVGPPKDAGDGTDLPTAMLIRDFVSTNLDRPDLGTELLVAAFDISRSALYRQFDSEGGVTRYIRNRRLDRCFIELSEATPRRGRVTAVARRWHFVDPSHFNRVFRERFGMAPSECLARKAVPGVRAQSDQVRIVKDWLAQIRRS